MTDIPGELLQSLRTAGACMSDIRTAAGKFGDLSSRQIESILQGLIDEGEELALSRLLQVCAFNRVKLDPKVLCGCIGLCETMLDSAPCFALQDEAAIEPLLGDAAAEALPVERQTYAARLAAELVVKFNLDSQPVRKVLWKLEPAALSKHQLLSGYQRALAFGLRELAFEMLLECEQRSNEEEFDQGHFEDLIEEVLQAGDLDLAHRIRIERLADKLNKTLSTLALRIPSATALRQGDSGGWALCFPRERHMVAD